MHTRLATDADVTSLRDLFISAYGENYVYPQFYQTEWLKKSVYDDNSIIVVAEDDKGQIVASGTVLLNAGGYNDMVGEIGRLIALPVTSGRGAGAAVVEDLINRIDRRILFSFSETRTIHRGAQRLAEQFGWQPVGFEPMKYLLGTRESMLVYADIKPMARELRRNNPRVIPEAAVLAQTALKNLHFPVDVIVEDESDGYPTGQIFETEHLQEHGITPLLRIERGRITNREIFGNFSLANGFFQFSDLNTHYIVARDGDSVVGAVGYSWDPIDRKVRIFEMIEFSDAVKGYLLHQVNDAAQKLGAEYQEVDVSAHAPRMQRTLERLGYIPAAYCPAMIFEHVERLDVIRMVRLNVPYDPGTLRLSRAASRIRDIVERELDDCIICAHLSENVRKAALFNHLPDGDLFPLLCITRVREEKPGTHLIRKGDATESIFLLGDMSASVVIDGSEVAILQPGATVGEMGLLEKAPRSADVFLSEGGTVIEIEIPRLERLMEQRPRLGHVVMRNLAAGLSAKLRKT